MSAFTMDNETTPASQLPTETNRLGIPIFHYCDIDSCLAILASKAIRLTHLEQTNDSKEGTEIIDVICDVLRTLDVESSAIGGWRSHFEMMNDIFQGFGFCMSEESDLLSQWRGYAGNGEGFAIGFDSLKLHQLALTHNGRDSVGIVMSLQKVEYDVDAKREFVREVAERIPQLLKDGALKHGRGATLLAISESQEEKKRQEVAATSLSLLHLILSMTKKYGVKHQAFREEKEWRLFAATMALTRAREIDHPFEHAWERIGFLKRNDSIIPFYELALDDPLVIKQIIVGPRNRTPDNVLESLLKKYGFTHVELRQSAATYR